MHNYWKIFFTSQFTTFCCPFHIRKKTSAFSSSCPYRSCYEAVTYRSQKSICAIFAAANLFWMQYFIRKAIPTTLVNSPPPYLALMAEVNNAFFKLSLLRLYWFRRDELIKIINFSMAAAKLSTIPKKRTFGGALFDAFKKIVFACWCFSYPVLSVVQNIYRASDQRKLGKYWMVTNFENGRKVLFLNCLVNAVPANQTLSTFESILSVVSAATEFNQDLLYTSRVIILVLPLATQWFVS